MMFQMVAFEEVVTPMVPGAWSLKAMNCAGAAPAASSSNRTRVGLATFPWQSLVSTSLARESRDRQMIGRILFVLVAAYQIHL
jgi:hypothetical protein